MGNWFLHNNWIFAECRTQGHIPLSFDKIFNALCKCKTVGPVNVSQN